MIKMANNEFDKKIFEVEELDDQKKHELEKQVEQQHHQLEDMNTTIEMLKKTVHALTEKSTTKIEKETPPKDFVKALNKKNKDFLKKRYG